MKNNRNMFFDNSASFGPNPSGMMPSFQESTNMNFSPMMPSMMGPMQNMNHGESKLNYLEKQIRKLEARVTKLENNQTIGVEYEQNIEYKLPAGMNQYQNSMNIM